MRRLFHLSKPLSVSQPASKSSCNSPPPLNLTDYLLQVLLLVQQKFEEASEFQSKVIESQEKVYGSDSLQLASFLEKIAFQYESNKNFQEALPYHERVLEIREKRGPLDKNHARLQAMLNLSYCLDQCGRFEDSLKFKTNALALMREQLGVEHRKVAH